MPLQGFECKGCGVSFEDQKPESPEQENEIKCPQCGGKDVVQSETASELLELISDMGSTGG